MTIRNIARMLLVSALIVVSTGAADDRWGSVISSTTSTRNGGEKREDCLIRSRGKYPLLRVTRTTRPEPGGNAVVVEEVVVADHLLVTLQPGRGLPDLEATLRAQNAFITRAMARSNLYLVGVADATRLDALAAALAGQRGVVATCDADRIVACGDAFIPKNARFPRQWNLNNLGPSPALYDADIDAPEAWSITRGTLNARVAVVDTGLDFDHPAFISNIGYNWNEIGVDSRGRDKQSNGVDDDANGYVDDWRGWDFVGDDNLPQDEHWHGSHCAGIVAGSDWAGTTGVCSRAAIVPVRVLDATGYGYQSDVVAAFRYLRGLNIAVASCSLTTAESETLRIATRDLLAAGVVVVACAGNDGGTTRAWPAAYDGVIAVAATDQQDNLAAFSNRGSWVDIAAPGDGILSAMPVTQTAAMRQDRIEPRTGLASGTSMAAPHVAGVCALIKSQNPSWSGSQIRQRLLSVGYDRVPDFEIDIERAVATGRVNAHRSLVPPDKPTISIDPVPFLAHERNERLNFCVSRTGTAGGRLRVRLGYGVESTASNGIDHGLLPTVIELDEQPESYQWIQLPIVHDDLAEGDETVVLHVLPSSDYALGRADACVPLGDQQQLDVVAFQASTGVDLYEGHAADVALLRFSGSWYHRPVVVMVGTTGAARLGEDFTATLPFPYMWRTHANENLRWFQLRPLADGISEPAESVQGTVAPIDPLMPCPVTTPDRPFVTLHDLPTGSG